LLWLAKVTTAVGRAVDIEGDTERDTAAMCPCGRTEFGPSARLLEPAGGRHAAAHSGTAERHLELS
jgi:hypothetical protein